MRTDLFDFDLPPERIALRPVSPRDAARLLVVYPNGRPELEDHQLSLLGDFAQSLVIVGEGAAEGADLLRDGSAIQRTIADRHGARRHAQGWDEAAVRRDHQILREEVERAVLERMGGASAEADAALTVLLRLIDRAEAISVAAWRRAAAAPMAGG